jgi:hypothetical protein
VRRLADDELDLSVKGVLSQLGDDDALRLGAVSSRMLRLRASSAGTDVLAGIRDGGAPAVPM